MAKVDDLLERRAKQVVLAIVARLAHRSPPTANLAVEGITDRPNRESQTARKPACTPGFLAKSITCSGQIIAIDQSLPNSSRTTFQLCEPPRLRLKPARVPAQYAASAGASQSSCRSTESVSWLAPPNTSRTGNNTLQSGGHRPRWSSGLSMLPCRAVTMPRLPRT